MADKGKELYKQGMKLIDIAEQLEQPAGTIRRWKNIYEWDSERSEKKSERSESKKKKPKRVLADGTKETLKNEGLTPEQQLFCVLYIKSFNATQSYMKAYNSSYNVANAEGYKLLVKPCIKKEIERLKEIKCKNLICTAEDLVELNMRIAFADIGDYVSFSGKSVVLRDSSKTDTQLIQEVKSGKSGISIKLADKNKAMDWLTKYFMLNPMDVHKQEFDKQRLELEYLKLEAQITENDAGNETEENNFAEMLNETAKEEWRDDGLDPIQEEVSED